MCPSWRVSLLHRGRDELADNRRALFILGLSEISDSNVFLVKQEKGRRHHEADQHQGGKGPANKGKQRSAAPSD